MPNLCIIPARALRDQALTPADLRVLLAVSIYTRAAGRGAYPSARTIGADARAGRATVFRSLDKLEQAGYLRRTSRWADNGRQTSSMYDVVLDEPAGGRVSQLGDGEGLAADGPTGVSPEGDAMNDLLGTTPTSEEGVSWRDRMDAYLAAYPRTDNLAPWVQVLGCLKKVCRTVEFDRILRAATHYASVVAREKTEPKYVTSPARFLQDGRWKKHDIVMVHGRTRQDWARSGQDLAEFDRLAAELTLPQESASHDLDEDTE
jgi:hypothetical protein